MDTTKLLLKMILHMRSIRRNKVFLTTDNVLVEIRFNLVHFRKSREFGRSYSRIIILMWYKSAPQKKFYKSLPGYICQNIFPNSYRTISPLIARVSSEEQLMQQGKEIEVAAQFKTN